MNNFALAPLERKQLQQFLLRAPSGRECCRAEALLWLDDGRTLESIADLLRVSRQTLYNWVRRFRERHEAPLEERLGDEPRSGRPPSALGIVDALIVEVIDKDPRDYGYHSTLWTTRLLQCHLRVVHQVEVSRKSVSRALVRLGLRWKRPRYVLAERSETWRQAKGG
jgi:transposase